MSTPQHGPEIRYLNRFAGLRPQSGKTIKDYDSASNLAEHITVARSSIKAQEKNILNLFSTAQELVEGINTNQQMLGRTFVKNMPQPSTAIKESPAKQLGYVQLSLRFFQAGVLHFMEQMTEADQRIEHLEKLLGKLAEYDSETDLIGEMESLDLDTLEGPTQTQKPPVNVQEKKASERKLTPPPTPTTPISNKTKGQVKSQAGKN